MKIINLIKCEFIKNYTLKKIILTLIVLMISILGITKFQDMYYTSDSFLDSHISFYKEEYEHLKQNNVNSLDMEYNLYKAKINIENYEYLKKFNNSDEIKIISYEAVIANQITNIDEVNFLTNKYLEDKNISLDFLEYDIIKEIFLVYQDMTDEEIYHFNNKLNIIKDKLKQILDEHKFYKYLEYQIELDKSLKGVERYLIGYNYYSENKEYYERIVAEKIENENDIRVKNLYQMLNLSAPNQSTEKARKLVEDKRQAILSILKYSFENNVKHDIEYFDCGLQPISYDIYLTTKNYVNKIYSLGVVVLLVVIITSGDIISKEHNKGTEKMLFTSPNKRWKILLSKFIYLILHTFIIWFLTLILLSIYAGIKYGFADLFTPKIIYFNGRIFKINYYLYTCLKIFYVSIPIISILSMLLMLSTITLNTSLIIGVNTAITVISPFLWHFIGQFKLTLLALTSIPYLTFNEVIELNENYLKTMEFVNISESYGIIISLITIIICYMISNFIYVKRDIKN